MNSVQDYLKISKTNFNIAEDLFFNYIMKSKAVPSIEKPLEYIKNLLDCGLNRIVSMFYYIWTEKESGKFNDSTYTLITRYFILLDYINSLLQIDKRRIEYVNDERCDDMHVRDCIENINALNYIFDMFKETVKKEIPNKSKYWEFIISSNEVNGFKQYIMNKQNKFVNTIFEYGRTHTESKIYY